METQSFLGTAYIMFNRFAKMKRTFNFKKGQIWDGDEEIFYFIEDQMVDKWGHRDSQNFGYIDQDIKAIVILERKPTKHNIRKIQSRKNRDIAGQDVIVATL